MHTQTILYMPLHTNLYHNNYSHTNRYHSTATSICCFKTWASKWQTVPGIIEETSLKGAIDKECLRAHNITKQFPNKALNVFGTRNCVMRIAHTLDSTICIHWLTSYMFKSNKSKAEKEDSYVHLHIRNHRSQIHVHWHIKVNLRNLSILMSVYIYIYHYL